MGPVRPTDVLAAFKRRWKQSKQLKALVPGGLHHQRAAQKKDDGPIGHPWAVIRVAEGQRDYNSSPTYLAHWTVTIEVTSKDGEHDAGQSLAEIDDVFLRSRHGLHVSRADRVTDLVSIGGGLGLAEQRHQGADQVLCSRQWELILQVTEPPAVVPTPDEEEE